MRLIVVTRPDFFEGEAERITALLAAGLETLHLRKPHAPAEAVERLLLALPERFRGRVVLHDHFPLAVKYGLRGVHLNGRNPVPPSGFKGSVSRSCHTFDEVRAFKWACDYVTLSPVFDSISKAGYGAAFTSEQLAAARADGTVDGRVVAMGGICPDNIGAVVRMGFGGAAVLGAVWSAPDAATAVGIFLSMKKITDGMEHIPSKVLSIAGSDPSGGAGIQADIKTVTALGGYAATAVTALTVQNTEGVRSVFPVPCEVVADQIAAVMEDIEPQAVKIGMVNDARIVRTIAEAVRRYAPRHVVFDPVMVATSGHRLIEENTVEAIERELIPLSSVITPNMSEAEVLWGQAIGTVERMERAARELSERYGTAVLVKGGHLDGDGMCDVLCCDGRTEHFTDVRIATRNLHGTGCTLSSAIAVLLAGGRTMREAVAEAKRYVTAAIAEGSRMSVGHGNGPLWHMAGR